MKTSNDYSYTKKINNLTPTSTSFYNINKRDKLRVNKRRKMKKENNWDVDIIIEQ